MDIGWDAPPDEDFNALLDDEDELEYIREIEIEQKRKQIEDIENLLENSGKVRNGGIAQLRHSSDTITLSLSNWSCEPFSLR